MNCDKLVSNIKILFEDNYYLAISKPQGIYSVPTGNPKNISVTVLFPHLLPTHRIDSDTSGVLLLAKSSLTSSRMIELFKTRNVKKKYIAISSNRVPETLHMEWKDRLVKGRKNKMKISEREGVMAMTEVVVDDGPYGSILKLYPRTGRTHQLRVQASYHGFPILGDRLYSQHCPYHRLMLHAYSLSFFHPFLKKEMTIEAGFPNDFQKFLTKDQK